MVIFEGVYRGIDNGLEYDVTGNGVYRVVKIISGEVERVRHVRLTDVRVELSEDGKIALYKARGANRRALKITELEESVS